ncbi:basic phospholipase A2 acanthin-1-like isoform X2 [Acropora muricata]|uniref:basic phospholipase A2 acanthin-1-like isoform X2 n=1 Tax=Acropora millepora TaxID=45264 RepID=UPI0010FCB347|nr:basic phospholipase A2 acanthin-1-like isoform X2 [Acropora millepora]
MTGGRKLGNRGEIPTNQGKMTAKRRHARSLFQFGGMVACSTNRSMFDYVDYGCWCGSGGSGKPVDQTDRCCLEHDLCYSKIRNDGSVCEGWSLFYIFFSSYSYTGCRRCEPEYKYPVDEKYKDCKKAICECDSQAAKCFGEAHYNKSHIVYDTSKCQSK